MIILSRVLLPLQNHMFLVGIHLVYILLFCINTQQITQYKRHCDKDANFGSLFCYMCNRRFFYRICVLNMHPYIEWLKNILDWEKILSPGLNPRWPPAREPDHEQMHKNWCKIFSKTTCVSLKEYWSACKIIYIFGRNNFIYILLPDIYIQQVMQYLRYCDTDKNCGSLVKYNMCNRKYFYNACSLNIHTCMGRFLKIKNLGLERAWNPGLISICLPLQLGQIQEERI